MYCGLVKLETLSNRFLCRLYELQDDRSCFIYNDRVISIDLLPSLTPIRELTLEQLLNEKGVRSQYQAYKGDRPAFQRAMEELLRRPPNNGSLKEQSFGRSSGISAHNLLIGLLYKERDRYLGEPSPIVPDTFKHAVVLQSATQSTPFQRQELLELFIEYPELYRNRTEKSYNHLLSSLIHPMNELMKLLEQQESRIPFLSYQSILRRFSHALELSRSLSRINLPSLGEADHGDDWVVTVENRLAPPNHH